MPKHKTRDTSSCKLCGHDVANHGDEGCCMRLCSCTRTQLPKDHPTYAEQAARIRTLEIATQTLIHERNDLAAQFDDVLRCIGMDALGIDAAKWARRSACGSDRIRQSLLICKTIKEVMKRVSCGVSTSGKLPSLEDLHAMKINITGGQDAADYVNQQRAKDRYHPSA